MTTLINCTPHAIIVHTEEGRVIALTPSGQVARVATTNKIVGAVGVGDCPVCEGRGTVPSNDERYEDLCGCGGVTLQIWESEFGEVEGLPEPKEDVFYVVSRLVLQACPERKDLLAPGQLIRDDDGRPIGCRGLSR